MLASNPFVRLPARGVHPVYWVGLSLICLAIDYKTGPVIQFPLFYLAPISMASWYGGRRWGLTLALILPMFRLYFRTISEPPWTVEESLINAAIRIIVFASFAWLIDRTARQMRELEHTRLLEGMLGVCSVCKKIRDRGANAWHPLESYVAAHPDEFKPDVCPKCMKDAADLFDRR